MTSAVSNAQATPAASPRSGDRIFNGRPDQIREARGFLAALLSGHPATHDAVMCLSELASNAIIHSRSGRPGGRFTVHAEICESRLRVEVSDDGGEWIQSPHLDELHGRGLLIVDQVARTWGRAGDQEAGWTVWFEMECPAPARQPPAGGAGQRWIVGLDGHRLRQLRRKLGLSQAELAGQAGVSLSVISGLERRARGSCRSRTLVRLAAALGEEPAALSASPDSGGRTEPA